MSRAKHRVRRSKAARLVGLGVFAGIILLAIGTALANPATPFFELDGGVTSQGVDDWATLVGGGGHSLLFSGLNEDIVNGKQLASKGTASQCASILPATSTLTTCDDVATGGNTKDDQNFSN